METGGQEIVIILIIEVMKSKNLSMDLHKLLKKPQSSFYKDLS